MTLPPLLGLRKPLGSLILKEDLKAMEGVNQAVFRALGGSWDLVPTQNWACKPTYILLPLAGQT